MCGLRLYWRTWVVRRDRGVGGGGGDGGPSSYRRAGLRHRVTVSGVIRNGIGKETKTRREHLSNDLIDTLTNTPVTGTAERQRGPRPRPRTQAHPYTYSTLLRTGRKTRADRHHSRRVSLVGAAPVGPDACQDAVSIRTTDVARARRTHTAITTLPCVRLGAAGLTSIYCRLA